MRNTIQFSLLFFTSLLPALSYACESTISSSLEQEYYTTYWLRYSKQDPAATAQQKYYPAAFKSKGSIEKLPAKVKEAVGTLEKIATVCNDCLHLHVILAKVTSDTNVSKIVHSQRVQALDCPYTLPEGKKH